MGRSKTSWGHRVVVLAALAIAVTLTSLGSSGVARAASTALRTSRTRETSFVPHVDRCGIADRSGAAERPDDPPIGVSLQTLSSNPSSTVLIDGHGLPDISDRNGITIVVLSATTRWPLECGTAPRSGGGLDLLTRIARRWASENTLVIVSGARGVPASDMSSLDALEKELGGTQFTSSEQTRLAAGASFSMLGNPGGLSGTAWTKVGTYPDRSSGGNITGWLQFNHVTGEYGYVSGHDVTFNTSAPGTPANGNTIEVNGRRYSGQLPAGATAGFEILSLDSQTLATRDVFFDQTGNEAGSARLAYDLEVASAARDSNPPPLVFVQSIGRPIGGSGGYWPAAAAAIGKLGGSPLAFLNLLGKSDYTLVGSTTAGPAATEAGTVLGEPGPESGVLAPGHDLGFLPVVAGPLGGVNLQLVNLEYQAPQAFPSINAAAENSIGQQVGLCGQSSSSCDFRTRFGSDYQRSWSQIHTDINTDSVKAPHSGPGFTDAQYQATRAELSMEISKFLQVKNYFTVLRDAFGASSQDRRVDVKAIGEQVYADVSPPPADKKLVFALGLVSNILKLGAFAGPPVSAVTGGLSGAFALGAYLAGKEADTTLADQVKVRADQLAKQSQAQISDAIDSLTTQARIVVTDWGKLQAASRYISDGDWRLPSDPKDYVPTLQRSIKQWFSESLVSVAYPWLIRGTPPPGGPSDANGLSCKVAGFFEFPVQVHPWQGEPANAQMRAVESWNSDGRANIPSYFFTRNRPEMSPDEPWGPNVISQKLADTMFGHRAGQLGINLYQFLSPRWFGALHNANDTAWYCDLYH